jgi:lipopolysaccharide transport system permease protein
MLLLTIFVIYYMYSQGWSPASSNLFLFPLLVLLMALQGLGLGMIVSSLTTRYRDLSLLLQFGIQLVMFSTTVVYPLSSLSGTLYEVVSLNPLTPIMEGIRYSLFGEGVFSASSLLFAFTASVVMLLSGILMFNRVEKTFIDTI